MLQKHVSREIYMISECFKLVN